MLIKAKSLKGYKLDSKDGEIGKVKEFYFDDKHWAIRYLVADTGTWLTGNQVLISPYALVSVNKEEEKIGINLTKNKWRTVFHWIVTSQSRTNSRWISMDIMDIRCIGEAHTCGELIHTLSVIVKNGEHQSRIRKSGILIYAVLTMLATIRYRPKMMILAMWKILSLMTRHGQFAI